MSDDNIRSAFHKWKIAEGWNSDPDILNQLFNDHYKDGMKKFELEKARYESMFTDPETWSEFSLRIYWLESIEHMYYSCVSGHDSGISNPISFGQSVFQGWGPNHILHRRYPQVLLGLRAREAGLETQYFEANILLRVCIEQFVKASIQTKQCFLEKELTLNPDLNDLALSKLLVEFDNLELGVPGEDSYKFLKIWELNDYAHSKERVAENSSLTDHEKRGISYNKEEMSSFFQKYIKYLELRLICLHHHIMDIPYKRLSLLNVKREDISRIFPVLSELLLGHIPTHNCISCLTKLTGNKEKIKLQRGRCYSCFSKEEIM